MIRSIVAGVVALALLPTVAVAARGTPPSGMRYGEPDGPPPGVTINDDRRWAEMGGAAAYRRPAYGYTLPRQWIAPEYVIGDYDSYDLPDPAAGFGWSRYYNDAVLTDRWGRVYDVRYDFEDESYRGRRHYRDRRYSGYAQPHWDMGYFEGHVPSYGYAPAVSYGDCNCGESVTTTTTRTLPGVARPVRTVTRYETVREPAPERVAVRRGKYVRVAR